MAGEGDLTIFLPERAIDDIADLLQERQHIAVIVKAAAEAEPAGSAARFYQNVAKSTHTSYRAVRDVVFALWSLSGLRAIRFASPDKRASILRGSLEQSATAAWLSEHLPLWNEAEAEIAKGIDTFTDDHPFSTSQKAQSLAFVHQNVLTSARLITDVRPVFDAAGTNILETVIIHTLSIQYTSGHNEPSTIDFALDAEDVASLLHACQRTETKIKTTTAALKDLKPIVFPQ